MSYKIVGYIGLVGLTNLLLCYCNGNTPYLDMLGTLRGQRARKSFVNKRSDQRETPKTVNRNSGRSRSSDNVNNRHYSTSNNNNNNVNKKQYYKNKKQNKKQNSVKSGGESTTPPKVEDANVHIAQVLTSPNGAVTPQSRSVAFLALKRIWSQFKVRASINENVHKKLVDYGVPFYADNTFNHKTHEISYAIRHFLLRILFNNIDFDGSSDFNILDFYGSKQAAEAFYGNLSHNFSLFSWYNYRPIVTAEDEGLSEKYKDIITCPTVQTLPGKVDCIIIIDVSKLHHEAASLLHNPIKVNDKDFNDFKALDIFNLMRRLKCSQTLRLAHIPVGEAGVLDDGGYFNYNADSGMYEFHYDDRTKYSDPVSVIDELRNHTAFRFGEYTLLVRCIKRIGTHSLLKYTIRQIVDVVDVPLIDCSSADIVQVEYTIPIHPFFPSVLNKLKRFQRKVYISNRIVKACLPVVAPRTVTPDGSIRDAIINKASEFYKEYESLELLPIFKGLVINSADYAIILSSQGRQESCAGLKTNFKALFQPQYSFIDYLFDYVKDKSLDFIVHNKLLVMCLLVFGAYQVKRIIKHSYQSVGFQSQQNLVKPLTAVGSVVVFEIKQLTLYINRCFHQVKTWICPPRLSWFQKIKRNLWEAFVRSKYLPLDGCYMSMFSLNLVTDCLISPICEEVIKINPICGTIFAFWEFFMYVHSGASYLSRLSPLFMHLVLVYGLPGRQYYFQRVMLHSLYNASLHALHNAQTIEDDFFINSCHPLSLNLPISQEKKIDFEPILLPTKDAVFDEASLTLSEDLTVKNDLPHLHIASFVGTYQPIVPVNTTSFVPSKSFWNMYSINRTRVMTAPLLRPLVQQKKWKKVKYITTLFKKLIEPILYDPYSFELEFNRFLTHFAGAKRKLYLAQYNYLKNNNYHVSTFHLNKCPTQIKCDEMIVKNEGDYGKIAGFKPRIINAIHVSIQVMCGPFLNEVAEVLKHHLFTYDNTNYITTKKHCFKWFYAPGQTFSSISDWFTECHKNAGVINIAAAGDDSLVVFAINGQYYYFEGDATSYDSTQSLGPLNCELEILKTFGMPDILLSYLEYSFKSTLVTRFNNKKLRSFKMSVNRGNRPMRNTGGPDTTFGNTIVMLIASTYAYNNVSIEDIEKAYARLGLRMKLHMYNSHHSVTFLKGWFVKNCEKYVWAPLPSRIVKLGKSLRTTSDIYKKDLRTSSKMFMHDVCYCLASCSIDPILETYTSNFILRYKSGYFDPNFTPDYLYGFDISVGEKVILNAKECKLQFCHRYQVSELVYDSFLKYLKNIKLFQILYHPIFQRMLEKDYP